MTGSPQQAQRILEISELAGGLAHEIRNPLSTLKVSLQLLAEEIRDEADAYIEPNFRRRALQRLDTLRAEVDHLHQILDDFLHLVTLQHLAVKPCDVHRALRELAEFFAPQARHQNVHIRTALAGGELICDLDEPVFRQALLNLLINAVQAMPGGGAIEIASGREGDRARIEIRDTGVGIEPQVCDRIFSPFFSTKKGGSGLGLSMTRRIVEDHGGTIRVRSQPGQGACFTIHLPLAEHHGHERDSVCSDC